MRNSIFTLNSGITNNMENDGNLYYKQLENHLKITKHTHTHTHVPIQNVNLFI